MEQVKTGACGGLVRGTYWDRKDYDAAGCLAARYHRFPELSDSDQYRCGSSK
jgi:hypothetical protein